MYAWYSTVYDLISYKSIHGNDKHQISDTTYPLGKSQRGGIQRKHQLY